MLCSLWKVYGTGHQLPAKGVLNRPTANSIQTNKNKINMAKSIRDLLLRDRVLQSTKSMVKPMIESRMLAPIKSYNDQFTSDENCMATKGTANKTAIEKRIKICLLLINMVEMEF